MNTKELPKNPIETTMKLVGCKWKILIVANLLDGTLRFNEIKKALKGVTQKVLTTKLRELEQNGILTREVYSKIPPKVGYTLTDVGYSLRPVIVALKDWGKDYKKYVKLLSKYNSDSD